MFDGNSQIIKEPDLPRQVMFEAKFFKNITRYPRFGSYYKTIIYFIVTRTGTV